MFYLRIIQQKKEKRKRERKRGEMGRKRERGRETERQREERLLLEPLGVIMEYLCVCVLPSLALVHHIQVLYH